LSIVVLQVTTFASEDEGDGEELDDGEGGEEGEGVAGVNVDNPLVPAVVSNLNTA